LNLARPDPALLDAGRYPLYYAVPTRYVDLDSNRHVNNVAVVALIEEAYARLNADMDKSAVTDRRIVVAQRSVSYLEEIGYPATVDVHIAVIAIGRTSWTVATLGVHAGIAAVYGEATLVGTAADRSALPDAFRAVLESYRIAAV